MNPGAHFTSQILINQRLELMLTITAYFKTLFPLSEVGYPRGTVKKISDTPGTANSYIY